MLPAILIEQTRAQAVNVAVAQDSVAVNMNLILKENLTSLPLINVQIGPTNSSSISQPFVQTINNAAGKLVATSRLSSLDVRIKTWNVSGLWFLEENYSMIMAGTNENSGSSIKSDLGFIPMNISQSLLVGENEVNAVGPAFLLPALESKSSSYTNLQYFIDGSQTRNAIIPDQTTKLFWLLDFSWVAPISTWTGYSDVLGRSTSWTLDPLAPRYNLTLGVPSPEGPLLASYFAVYSPSLVITVPARAWATGNTVYFDISNPNEIAMPIIVITSLVLAIATFFADRRIARLVRPKKKR